MNLWLRLLWLLLTAWRRPGIKLPDGFSSLRFRVWPSDLDTSLHMNNGRYWTLMDLGRVDVVIRSGLASAVFKKSWTPIVSAGKVRFRRELRTFEPFILQTKIVFWNETRIVLEQRFLRISDNSVAAIALVLAGFYDRKRKAFVSTQELFDTIGDFAEVPEMSPEVAAFLEAESTFKNVTANG